VIDPDSLQSDKEFALKVHKIMSQAPPSVENPHAENLTEDIGFTPHSMVINSSDSICVIYGHKGVIGVTIPTRNEAKEFRKAKKSDKQLIAQRLHSKKMF
jgi:hypothetical protein